MGKIIAIFNQKGGVGKTTTNVNLAVALALKGKKVLVVDNDPQGNCTSGLGIDKSTLEYSLYDLLMGDELPPVESHIVKTSIDRVHVIPSTMQLAGAEVEMIEIKDRESRLKRILGAVKDQYDYLLVDCPPSLGLLTVNSLVAADSVIIPIQCEYYALEGVSQLVSTYELVRRNLNSNLAIEGVLLTMFDARTNLSMQVVEEVKKYFEAHVYKSIIPKNVRVAEAPSFGLPVVLYDPKSKGSLAYIELAKEVIKRNTRGKHAK